jgi:glycosyltransferase involved in cell wall biosynthesis
MTDPLGQSQVLPYLKGLSREGYEFHLISFEKSDRFNQHKRLIQSLCDEDNIQWHPQYYSKVGGLRSTLKQVKKLKKVSSYLYSKHSFDIVHCRSYISALAGLDLKRKHGVKFVFDMRGFWADERVDGKIWSLKSPIYNRIYKYFKKKEKVFLDKADYTISLTDNGKNEILSWPSTDPKINIKVIPCCANLELFDKSKISEDTKLNDREKLGIDSNDFILGYIGSIGTWYMLPEMLDYFKELKEAKPNSKFLLVSGEEPSKIIAAASEKGIDKDHIKLISVLHHEVPRFISLMDASIFFIKPSYSKKASSPTKQGEIMAMGVPLICNANVGDTDLIVTKYESGIVIDKFDKETFKNNIIDPQDFDSNKISEGAEDYFSLTEGVQRYLRVYKAVCE